MNFKIMEPHEKDLLDGLELLAIGLPESDQEIRIVSKEKVDQVVKTIKVQTKDMKIEVSEPEGKMTTV